MNETEILGGILRRDEAALTILMEQYTKLLWVVVSGTIGKQSIRSTHDIEACVSDTFLALWREPAKYEPERGSLKTYLSMQARSRARDFVRQQIRKQTDIIPIETLEQTSTNDSNPEDEMIAAERGSALLGAIEQITEPTKTILIWRYFFDLKPQAISERLNMPKKEVENKLYQGKKKLKALLSSQDMEESI